MWLCHDALLEWHVLCCIEASDVHTGGGGNLVWEETCLEKFHTANSGAIFPITFNDCGGIFPILFFGHQVQNLYPVLGLLSLLLNLLLSQQLSLLLSQLLSLLLSLLQSLLLSLLQSLLLSLQLSLLPSQLLSLLQSLMQSLAQNLLPVCPGSVQRCPLCPLLCRLSLKGTDMNSTPLSCI